MPTPTTTQPFLVFQINHKESIGDGFGSIAPLRAEISSKNVILSIFLRFSEFRKFLGNNFRHNVTFELEGVERRMTPQNDPLGEI